MLQHDNLHKGRKHAQVQDVHREQHTMQSTSIIASKHQSEQGATTQTQWGSSTRLEEAHQPMALARGAKPSSAEQWVAEHQYKKKISLSPLYFSIGSS
jgi:hypothetical protein